ncbi:MAG: DUF6273 domain-containing protein [Lachnospiraceae bacterium]|nr:DUF6273 domain-containing protein [Lachnospiraceae bacterium]
MVNDKKTKMIRKITAMVLAGVLITGMLPAELFAAHVWAEDILQDETGVDMTRDGNGAYDRRVVGVRTNALCRPDKDNGGGWCYVYYGRYDTDGDDTPDPIRYRVLDKYSDIFGVEGGSLLLDCDVSVRQMQFDIFSETDWRTSSVKKFLNGTETYGTGDFTQDFTQLEISSIASSSKAAPDENDGSPDGTVKNRYCPLDNDRIFLLDGVEAVRPSYGYGTTAPRSKYSPAQDRCWYLRSPVNDNGAILNGIIGMNYTVAGRAPSVMANVCPAFNIGIDSIVFTSLLSGNASEAGSEYKLSLLDEDIVVNPVEITTDDGSNMNVRYSLSGDHSGNVNQVSIVMLDGYFEDYDSSVKFYQKLSGSNVNAGSGSFSIPIGYDPSWITYLVAETVNEGTETDYASYPVMITMPSSVRIYDRPVAVSGLVYDGTDKQLVTPGRAPYGIKYALGNNASDVPADGWSDEIPAGREVGTYYVWYYANGYGSLANSEAGCVTVEIKKAGIPGDLVSETGLGTGLLCAPDSVNGGGFSYVYFGKDLAAPSSGPGKFRALDPASGDFSIDGGSLLLDYDGVYKRSGVETADTWAESSSKAFLNDPVNGYLSWQWLRYFEADAIGGSTKTQKAEGDEDTEEFSALSGEKVFLLSPGEAANASYGYGEDASRIKEGAEGASWWNLRAAGEQGSGFNSAGLVSDAGSIRINVDPRDAGQKQYMYLSPALNVKLNSILFTSLVSGKAGEPGAVYRLTVIADKKGENVDEIIPDQDGIVQTYDSVSIPYEIKGDIGRGSCDVLILILDKEYAPGNANNAEIKHLFAYQHPEGAANGTVSFDIPSDFEDGWKVYLVARSGDDGQYGTYLASEPTEALMPVRARIITAPEAVPGLSADGTLKELVTAGEGDPGIEYCISKSGKDVPATGWSEDVPSAIAPGTYHVWYRAKGDDSTGRGQAYRVTVTMSGSDKYIAGLAASPIGNPDPVHGGGWDYVYFGRYDTALNGTPDPVKYRVLDPSSRDFGAENGSLFMDCDRILDYRRFDSRNMDWKGSALQKWLNSESGLGFLNRDNFTGKEISAIAASVKGKDSGRPEDKSVPLYGDKVFILQVHEARTPAYGYVSDPDRIKRYDTEGRTWWLRSVDDFTTFYSTMGTVQPDGLIAHDWEMITDDGIGVSPALNIDPQRVVFSRLVWGAPGITGSEYKLEVVDDDLEIWMQHGSYAVKNGDRVTVPYSVKGRDAGEADRIAVMILDKQYTPGNVNSANIRYLQEFDIGTETQGSVTFTLPEDYKERWRIYLVAEDTSDTNDTDYASVPFEICLHQSVRIDGDKAADCCNKGYSGDTYCGICGKLRCRGEELPVDPGNHVDEREYEIVKPPSAETLYIGIRKVKCVCGHEFGDETYKEEGTGDDSGDLSQLSEDAGLDPGSITIGEQNGQDEDGNPTTETVIKVGDEEVQKTITDKDGEQTVETDIWIGGLHASYPYTGEAQKPVPHVYDGMKLLTEGRDYSVGYANNKNISDETKKNGLATLTVTFKGNYKATPKETVKFKIVPSILGNAGEEGAQAAAEDMIIAATGRLIKPVPAVTFVSTGRVMDKRNFKFEYTKNGAPVNGITGEGDYQVTVKPNNANFSGSSTATIHVVPLSDKGRLLSGASVKIKSFTYTGQGIVPDVDDYTVTLNRKKLRCGVDFKATITGNNKDPGKVTVVLTAMDQNPEGYIGSTKGVFTINAGRKLMPGVEGSPFSYTLSSTDVPYAKGGAKPEITVKDGDNILVPGVDYTVSYSKNTKVTNGSPTAVATVNGKGKYKGNNKLYFTVRPQALEDIIAGGGSASAADKIISRNGFKNPAIVITDTDGKALRSGADFAVDPGIYAYTVTGPDGKEKEPEDISAGDTVTVRVNGKGNYTGSILLKYRYIAASSQLKKTGANKIEDKVYTGREIKLGRADLKQLLFTGKASAPDYLIPAGSTGDNDFTVLYYSNNINTGTAGVTLAGRGNWGGTRTLTFKIISKKRDYKGAFIDGTWYGLNP